MVPCSLEVCPAEASESCAHTTCASHHLHEVHLTPPVQPATQRGVRSVSSRVAAVQELFCITQTICGLYVAYVWLSNKPSPVHNHWVATQQFIVATFRAHRQCSHRDPIVTHIQECR